MTPLAVQTLPVAVVAVLVRRHAGADLVRALAQQGHGRPLRRGPPHRRVRQRPRARRRPDLRGVVPRHHRRDRAGRLQRLLARRRHADRLRARAAAGGRAAAQPRQVHARRRHRHALREPRPARLDRGRHDHHDRHLHDGAVHRRGPDRGRAARRGLHRRRADPRRADDDLHGARRHGRRDLHPDLQDQPAGGHGARRVRRRSSAARAGTRSARCSTPPTSSGRRSSSPTART